MEEIVEHFNMLFGPEMHAVIENNQLKITNGNETLLIGLPGLPAVVGASSMGPLPKA